MTDNRPNLYVGRAAVDMHQPPVHGGFIEMSGETTYRISNYDQMPPFFMSLVSGADHWLFISSNGGLTAGRIDADSALFPYETEDKITAHHEQTGSKAIIRAQRDGRVHLWEPFSDRYRGLYRCERHLYKNIAGNTLIFEEVNHDLQLTLRAAWRTGDRFGFIKSSWLHNWGKKSGRIELLDGLQNIMPYGATHALQTSFSSLLNGYKRNELDARTGMGLFSLSATLTDQAEPSESLKTTVAWQHGLQDGVYLLCSDQLDDFRQGRRIRQEEDLRGKAGSYFVNATIELGAGQAHHWHIVADVNQDSAAVVRLARFLAEDRETIEPAIEADIIQGAEDLKRYVAAADGLQLSAHQATTAHHFANTLFNIMRGGLFADGYQVQKADLLAFIRTRNRVILQTHPDWFSALPERLHISELYALAAATGEPDLRRLCYEYLPLFFSRRHGDPSRPWNRFSIHLKKADGSRNLDYQGNWRDIFQNWEPLALSYPAYVEGMIAKFLNATTADGYNPYRVTRSGIEWEVPEPDNPWANIGYWSDHQIIYLQKLLEIAEQVHPGRLTRLWNEPVFSYANVPYRIRPYQALLQDWTNTINFDWEVERDVQSAVAQMGTDGRLLRDAAGNVLHVTMVEKLLVLMLAKLTNLVPEGGIWMNTQRPEWNDANNALVGKGLSVVTAAYLYRFITFWQLRLAGFEEEAFTVNSAVYQLYSTVQATLSTYQNHLQQGFDDRGRKAFMDQMGEAASEYRATIYQMGLPETKNQLSGEEISHLLSTARAYIEHTLRANRRSDNLFHTYNILQLDGENAAVENLYLMLEGQVAILSAGILTADESLGLLQHLRSSALYRPDQHSYMLYPNRDIPGFRQKNNVSAAQVAGSTLVEYLDKAGDTRLLIRDEMNDYHFNGSFRNAEDVQRVLNELEQDPALAEWVTAERAFILDLFETTFNHRAFTGRSGTFFAYEGLGSIYWHMVAKLLLATQECYQQALASAADEDVIAGLEAAYYDIRSGIGFNKSPQEYGAFPSDPYSHTPMGDGARQPGMTGQVKEEILTRWGELGVSVQDGVLQFRPTLLQADEFMPEAAVFTTINAAGETRNWSLPAHSLAFTYCQTPIIYTSGQNAKIEVTFAGGQTVVRSGGRLDEGLTRQLLDRDQALEAVQVTIEKDENQAVRDFLEITNLR